MTTINIVNLLGWLTLIAAWGVKAYMTRKEEKLQVQLDEKISVAKSPEEIQECEKMFLDIHTNRFGVFGSWGVSVQIMSFGIGLFISNFIHLIFK
jgi:hypothetical protein